MTGGGTYASPPCMAGEIAPDYFDPLAVDPQQSVDVARWRKAERLRLGALRDGLGLGGRNEVSAQIQGRLAKLLPTLGLRTGSVLSGYWPIKGEPDLRPLLADLHRAGVTIALPVVETRAAPLVFRRWTPETRMVRGDWNIPVPPTDTMVLTPDFALAPCLGWTGDCYRLGWGGGYFDRTLPVLAPRPVTIGIALTAARLATIFPQPHDIPLDQILTEDGLAATRAPK